MARVPRTAIRDAIDAGRPRDHDVQPNGWHLVHLEPGVKAVVRDPSQPEIPAFIIELPLPAAGAQVTIDPATKVPGQGWQRV
jgi:hypothetical protein